MLAHDAEQNGNPEAEVELCYQFPRPAGDTVPFSPRHVFH